MRNPCFDESTRSDCPDRKKGCATHCKEWADYVKRRDRRYQERRAEKAADRVLRDGDFDRIDRYQKDKIKTRARKRTYNNH